MGVPSILFLSLVVVLLYAPTLCVKVDYSKSASYQFGEYVQKSFGMAENGVISIDYNVYPQDPSLPYESYALILILNDAQQRNWYSLLDNSEADIVDNIDGLCNQPSLQRIQPWGAGRANLTITPSIGSDLFTVVVLQCRVGDSDNPVTVEVDLSMVNARPEGSGTSHLPIQFVMLTRVFQGFIIAYSLLVVGILGQYYSATRTETNYFQNINFCFMLTAVLKLLWCILQFYEFYKYNREGEDDFSARIAVQAFGALTSIAGLTTLLLLSMGWSVLRERLPPREAQFAKAGALLYFVFQFGASVCSDTTSKTCEALSLVAFVIRSLILLSIIILMNFTYTQLRAMLSHTPWVPSTPLQYARHKQFQVFRFVVVCYLLLPTIYLLIEVTTLNWREQWVIITLGEATDLLFFFYLGVTFSPLYEPILTRGFDGSLRRAE